MSQRKDEEKKFQYSKIKNILIELPGFRYFHSPSAVGKVDDRFIGREAIIKKLRSILLNADTKSGAYLVAGFRGMGKTSFVNHVLDSINNTYFRKSFRARIPLIAIPMIIYGFAEVDLFNFYGEPEFPSSLQNILYLLSLLTYIIILLPFLYFIYLKDEIKKKAQGFKKLWFKKIQISWNKTLLSRAYRYCYALSLIYLFEIGHVKLLYLIYLVFFGLALLIYNFKNYRNNFNRNEKWKIKISSFTQLFYFLLNIAFITICGYILHRLYSVELKDKNVHLPVIVTLDFLITKYVYSHLENLSYKRRGQMPVFKEFVDNLGKKIRSSQKIFIKLNLGRSGMEEGRVLTLIHKAVLAEYRKINLPFLSMFRTKGQLIIFLTVILSAYIFYSSERMSYMLEEDIRNAHLVEFFPSQAFLKDSVVMVDPVVFKNLDIFNSCCYSITKGDSVTYTHIDGFIHRYDSPQLASAENNGWKSHATASLRLVDYTIFSVNNWFYHFTKNILNIIIPFSKKNNPWALTLPVLDYIYLFIVFLFWIFLVAFTKLLTSFGGVVTHRNIYNRLRRLDEMIEAQVSKEHTSELGPKGKGIGIFRIGIKKQSRYRVKGSRDIESELIEIFEDMQRVPKFFGRPEFVFIFDELDKVQPSYTDVERNNKEKFEYEDERGSLFTIENSRKRQEMIAKLLSGMKQFFTTAMAKFIFISGHEMYDAALADTSDRESFIGSIFHDVIYVDSFYSDEKEEQSSDITALTEKYVCRILLNETGYTDASLEGVSAYFKEHAKRLFHNTENSHFLEKKSETNNYHQRLILSKTMMSLQFFIVYLAYRSNGAPKKMTKLFENHIEECKADDQKLTNPNYLVVGTITKPSFYLNLDFKAQYKHGLTTRLFHPFMLAKGRYVTHLSDKLLVSTSFLIDHLYKYHKYGFSWKNIEHSPEIISINKSPQLRGFIEELIFYLSNTHLNEIVSGLYNFKFDGKIQAEIEYVSKISELESAAFNFTLDESLKTKRYFLRKLSELRKVYSELQPYGKYIHSIGLVNMTLGDLYYYDQEYDVAISYYQDAIQELRYKRGNKPDPSISILLINNMLKLGLTFERKKDYTSALNTYTDLTESVIDFRAIDVKKYGYKELVLAKQDFEKNSKKIGTLENEVFRKNPWLLNSNNKLSKWGEHIFTTGRSADMIVKNEKIEGEKKDIFHSFINNFIHTLPSINKEKYYNKLTVFENLRLMYQPILTKLQLIEKLSGITRSDLKRSGQEFEYLIKVANKQEKFTITSEYYNKVGDLLYYKNGTLIPGHKNNGDSNVLPKPIAAKNEYFKSLLIIYHRYLSKSDTEPSLDLDNKLKNEKLFKDDLRVYYRNRNKDFHADSFECESQFHIMKVIYETFSLNKRPLAEIHINSVLVTLANTLSDLGDTFLSLDKEQFGQWDIDMILSALKKEGNECPISLPIPVKIDNNYLNYAVLSNIYAATVYKKAGKHQKSAFQYIKILYAIHIYLASEKHNNINNNLKNKISDHNKLPELVNKLFELAIKDYHFSTEHSYRLEEERYKEIFSISQQPTSGISTDLGRLMFEYSANNADIRELVILYCAIDAQLTKDEDTSIRFPLDKNIINAYNSMGSMYDRILELLLKGYVNKKHFRYNKKHYGNHIYIIEKFKKFLDNIKIDGETLSYEHTALNSFLEANFFTHNNSLIEEKFKTFLKSIKVRGKNIHQLNSIPRSLLQQITSPIIRFNPSCLRKVLLDLHKAIFSKYNLTFKGKSFKNIQFFELESFNKINHPPSINNYSNKKYEYLILDSIFCLFDVLNFASLFSNRYIVRHSVLAHAHKEMGFWCGQLWHYVKVMDGETVNSIKKGSTRLRMEVNLDKLIGKKELKYLSKYYHYEQAISHYEKAKQMHSAGEAYTHQLDSMYYLDDDFNDELSHFFAALERFKIQLGIVDSNIEELQKELEKSELYNPKRYTDLKV
ncbi:tetratricopeptide repeat protein [Flammeovirgaceae bacterium SG7u.111]|nr:tetratricopeptide repeat protein [Flammeovirgaceae bacterium SG7u.132]WPO33042.1 tetratricopeptide repeat protein [Flammeovirgaceae bacterium SG7u.111]